MVSVVGFEPTLCLLPKQVPYQARRYADKGLSETFASIQLVEVGVNLSVTCNVQGEVPQPHPSLTIVPLYEGIVVARFTTFSTRKVVHHLYISLRRSKMVVPVGLEPT